MIHLFSSPQRRRQSRFFFWLAIIGFVVFLFSDYPGFAMFWLFTLMLASFGARRKAKIQDEHYAHVAKIMKEVA